jgi:hypothetical protein
MGAGSNSTFERRVFGSSTAAEIVDVVEIGDESCMAQCRCRLWLRPDLQHLVDFLVLWRILAGIIFRGLC